ERQLHEIRVRARFLFSLDHLVHPRLDRLGDPDAERVCGLEVDHGANDGDLLDGNLGRPGAFQNSQREIGGGLEKRPAIDPVEHQAARFDVLAAARAYRQLLPGGKLEELVAVIDLGTRVAEDQTLYAVLLDRREAALER